MNEPNPALADLQHIRSIMARTVSFVSFSGYSAILIGSLWIVVLGFIGPRLDHTLAGQAGVDALFGPLLYVSWGLGSLFVTSFVIGLIVSYQETRAGGERFFTPASLRVAGMIVLFLVAGAVLGLCIARYSITLAAGAVPLLYSLLLLSLARYSRHDILPLMFACLACGLYSCITGHIWLAYILSLGVAHLGYGVWLKITKR